MLAVESLSGIATFVVTSHCASFTEAGERLGVSKSAVGKAIAKLESRLGAKLFLRTTRSITLTADGEAYLAVCVGALKGIAAAELDLGSGSDQPAGRLRVDMPAAFGRKVVMPMLIDAAKQFPLLQLTLTFSDDVIDIMDEGVDLAIRFGTLDDTAELIARKLTSHRWIVCAAPSYLKTYGEPASLEAIAEHRCIVGHRRGQPLAWHITVDDVAQRFSPPPTYQFSDADAMIDATIAGLGLCQMPDALFRKHVDNGHLQSVLDPFTASSVDVHAVWPRTSQLRPKVRYVVDKLLDMGRMGALDIVP